jgi:ribonucleoside-diphosphate reductase alpha chain
MIRWPDLILPPINLWSLGEYYKNNKEDRMTENSNIRHLPTSYQEFIALSRYSRWVPEKSRRETWNETVDRVVRYWQSKFPDVVTGELGLELYEAIYNLEVMPSMRTLMTAGPALDRDNVAGFNCSYAAIDSPRKFDEIMYILMCGTGVGFSVERQFVSKLPCVAEEFYSTDSTISVSDSKIGWASSFRELISLLYVGKIPRWDLSKVRPAGSVLKTFGGRASGPEPLEDLFKFAVTLFKNAAGRKLTSLECHDLVCKIAEIVVVGGVRRSALISLSNLSDDRMRTAKSGAWWESNVQRALANNSACYTEKPEIGIFMKEWLSLYESKSGERGVFNREAANKLLPDRRKEAGYTEWGTNPCSEIVLRSAQF